MARTGTAASVAALGASAAMPLATTAVGAVDRALAGAPISEVVPSLSTIAPVALPLLAPVASLLARPHSGSQGNAGSRAAARVGDRVGRHGGGGGALQSVAAAGAVVGALAGLSLGGPSALVSAIVGAASRPSPGAASLGGGCGQIAAGSPNVFIEGRAVARASADGCGHGHEKLSHGSATVYVNGKPLTRVGDASHCGGTVITGAGRTLIGGASATASGGGAGGRAAAGVAAVLLRGLTGALSGQLLQLASNQFGALLAGALPALPEGVAGALQQAGGMALGVATGAVTGQSLAAAASGQLLQAASSGVGSVLSGAMPALPSLVTGALQQASSLAIGAATSALVGVGAGGSVRAAETGAALGQADGQADVDLEGGSGTDDGAEFGDDTGSDLGASAAGLDPRTGEPVGRFIGTPGGEMMVEPPGGRTTGGGGFYQTRRADESPYQRIDPGHPRQAAEVSRLPHGHAYDAEGNALSLRGEVVPRTSPEAHIPLRPALVDQALPPPRPSIAEGLPEDAAILRRGGADGESWVIYRPAEGPDRVRFRAEDARTGAPINPGQGAYSADAEAGLTAGRTLADDRVFVLEGRHRAVGAAQGDAIPAELGGVPGQRGVLDYEFYNRYYSDAEGHNVRDLRDPSRPAATPEAEAPPAGSRACTSCAEAEPTRASALASELTQEGLATRPSSGADAEEGGARATEDANARPGEDSEARATEDANARPGEDGEARPTEDANARPTEEGGRPSGDDAMRARASQRVASDGNRYGFDAEAGVYRVRPDQAVETLGRGAGAMEQVPRDARFTVLQQSLRSYGGEAAARALAAPDGTNGGALSAVARQVVRTEGRDIASNSAGALGDASAAGGGGTLNFFQRLLGR